MHAIEKGDLSVAVITVRFIKLGYVVLKPITELSRYDLVIDRKGDCTFERIQCKTGRIRGDTVKYNVKSWTKRGSNFYHGQADYFAVYCLENDSCYLIPVEGAGYLRLSVSSNGHKYKLANDYIL